MKRAYQERLQYLNSSETVTFVTA